MVCRNLIEVMEIKLFFAKNDRAHPSNEKMPPRMIARNGAKWDVSYVLDLLCHHSNKYYRWVKTCDVSMLLRLVFNIYIF